MPKAWAEEGRDPASGRVIFAREVAFSGQGTDFKIERDFQVRGPDGSVLLQVNGSGDGEHWCGVFVFFVDDTDGRRVRLYQSNKDDAFHDVPDTPLPAEALWE